MVKSHLLDLNFTAAAFYHQELKRHHSVHQGDQVHDFREITNGLFAGLDRFNTHSLSYGAKGGHDGLASFPETRDGDT